MLYKICCYRGLQTSTCISLLAIVSSCVWQLLLNEYDDDDDDDILQTISLKIKKKSSLYTAE